MNIIFKLGKKVVELESGNFYIKTDKKYYSDILEKNSVLELTYLNKMDTLEENDIIAILLDLQLRKVIKIKDNQIISVNRSIPTTKGEDYLIRKCISGKLILDRLDILTELARNDASASGLIKKETNILKDIAPMFIKINIISFIISILFLIFIKISIDIEGVFFALMAIIILLMGVIFMYRWVYFISYVIHKFKSYEVTEKGKDIKIKLNGLKKYLEDFSNIEDNSVEIISLLEDYLIYSVMFGINHKVKKDMKNLMKVEVNSKISKKVIFIN